MSFLAVPTPPPLTSAKLGPRQEQRASRRAGEQASRRKNGLDEQAEECQRIRTRSTPPLTGSRHVFMLWLKDDQPTTRSSTGSPAGPLSSSSPRGSAVGIASDASPKCQRRTESSSGQKPVCLSFRSQVGRGCVGACREGHVGEVEGVLQVVVRVRLAHLGVVVPAAAPQHTTQQVSLLVAQSSSAANHMTGRARGALATLVPDCSASKPNGFRVDILHNVPNAEQHTARCAYQEAPCVQ